MSTGGIFQLIASDGQADRMLMATALINKRLAEIMNLRKYLYNPKSLENLCIIFIINQPTLLEQINSVSIDLQEKINDAFKGVKFDKKLWITKPISIADIT
jgi:hypothetical protein